MRQTGLFRLGEESRGIRDGEEEMTEEKVKGWGEKKMRMGQGEKIRGKKFLGGEPVCWNILIVPIYFSGTFTL